MTKSASTKKSKKSNTRTHMCDSCCTKRATHNVSRYDSFYKHLCNECYEAWLEDHDDSWDETSF